MHQSKKHGTVIFHLIGVHTGHENLSHKSLLKKLSSGDRVVLLRNCGTEANFMRVSGWLFTPLTSSFNYKFLSTWFPYALEARIQRSEKRLTCSTSSYKHCTCIYYGRCWRVIFFWINMPWQCFRSVILTQ